MRLTSRRLRLRAMTGILGVTAALAVPLSAQAAVPTATVTVARSLLPASGSSLVTATFTEPVMGVGPEDFSLQGATLSAPSTSDGGWTWTATLTAGTTNVVAGNVTLDLTGVTSITTAEAGVGTVTSNTFDVDATRPTVTVTSSVTQLLSGESGTLTLRFSEPILVIGLSDISVPGAVVSDLSTTSDPLVYTARVTALSGVIRSTTPVVGTGWRDLAGNAPAADTTGAPIDIASLGPSVTISVGATSLRIGETSSVQIRFSEEPLGFSTATDLRVVGGSLDGLTRVDTTTFTATFVPEDGVQATTGSISVISGSYVGPGGNSGGGATATIAIDTQAPTVTLTLDDPLLSSGETTTVRLVFSEPVTGVFSGGLNALIPLGPLTAVDGGRIWTATVLAGTTGWTDLRIGYSLIGVHDLAGNPVAARSVLTDPFDIDTTRPSVFLTSMDGTNLRAGQQATVEVHFTEPVQAAPTVSGPHLTAGTPTTADGGSSWTIVLTPDADTLAVFQTLTIDMAAVRDLAGNPINGTTTATHLYSIDTRRPTATVDIADTVLTGIDTTIGTITFSEAVTSFGASAITAPGLSVGTPYSIDGGATWYVSLSALADTAATGTVTVDLTRMVNGAGNAGVGTASSTTYEVDTVRPTLAITVGGTPQVGVVTPVTFRFSRAVLGFTDAAVSTSAGTLSALVTTDGGRTYTADLTPTSTASGALVTANLLGVTDTVGNTPATLSASSAPFAVLDVAAPPAAAPAPLPMLVSAGATGLADGLGLATLLLLLGGAVLLRRRRRA